MNFVLKEFERNNFLESRICEIRFPERHQQEAISFSHLLARFLKTGSVNYKQSESEKQPKLG